MPRFRYPQVNCQLKIAIGISKSNNQTAADARRIPMEKTQNTSSICGNPANCSCFRNPVSGDTVRRTCMAESTTETLAKINNSGIVEDER